MTASKYLNLKVVTILTTLGFKYIVKPLELKL